MHMFHKQTTELHKQTWKRIVKCSQCGPVDIEWCCYCLWESNSWVPNVRSPFLDYTTHNSQVFVVNLSNGHNVLGQMVNRNFKWQNHIETPMAAKVRCDEQAVREWREAGAVIAEEHHLCTAPVSYLSGTSGSIKGGATTVKDKPWSTSHVSILIFVLFCGFCFNIKVVDWSSVPASLFLHKNKTKM